jgi:hypothetical protein
VSCAILDWISVIDECCFRQFTGDIAKNVRVGITNFFETLILCCETQNEFGPPVSEAYDHY